MKKIGYFPIKESEIKEIIKMILAYKKSDYTTLDEITKKYNVNDTKKKKLYDTFEKCLKNKDSRYFDTFYGVGIAKAQRMYRGHFSIEDKSITQLVTRFPMLKKYTKRMEEFIKFKNNKYKFINYLDFPESSGAYIPCEKAKELYDAYYCDEQIKNVITAYYGSYSNKFLEILEYSSDNGCGVLEADLGEEVQKVEEKSAQVEETKNTSTVATSPIPQTLAIETQTNPITPRPKVKKAKPIVKTGKMTASLIGYFILFSLLIGFFYSIAIEIVSNTVRTMSTDINQTLIITIISLILQAVSVFFIWKITINRSFSAKSIDSNNITKIMINMFIFIFVVCGLYVGGTLLTIDSKIDKAYESSMKLQTALMQNYGTKQQKEEHIIQREKLLEAVKKETYKYATITCIGTSIIYLAILPYERKQIKKKIAEE